MMIGELIRRIRLSEGLTMAELAKRAGVSTGYISHIEKNRVNPSLAVLGRLADGLNIPLERLLSDQNTGKATVVRKNDRSLIKFTDLPMPGQLLTPMLRRGMFFRYDAIEMHIPPHTNCGNQETPMPLYYETDDCFYVVSGEVVCTYDDGETTVRAGGSAYVPRGVASHIGNQSDEEAVILLVTKLQG